MLVGHGGFFSILRFCNAQFKKLEDASSARWFFSIEFCSDFATPNRGSLGMLVGHAGFFIIDFCCDFVRLTLGNLRMLVGHAVF